jgi:hypothetical protein
MVMVMVVWWLWWTLWCSGGGGFVSEGLRMARGGRLSAVDGRPL